MNSLKKLFHSKINFENKCIIIHSYSDNLNIVYILIFLIIIIV